MGGSLDTEFLTADKGNSVHETGKESFHLHQSSKTIIYSYRKVSTNFWNTL